MRKKNGKPGRKRNVKKENKKPGRMLAVYGMCMLLAGCAPSVAEDKIEIHPVVSKFLEGMHIERSAILSLGDYSDISYHLETPEITEEEIDVYEEELADDYGIEEVTLDFIKDHFDLSSYDEFREWISKRELSHKKYVDTEQCREDMAQDIDANVVSELSGEAAQQAQDVMAGDIEYKVVAHS